MVRPVVAELRRRFEVAAAETGRQDLHRRAEIVGRASSASDHAHVTRGARRPASGWSPGVRRSSCCRHAIRVLDDDDLD